MNALVEWVTRRKSAVREGPITSGAADPGPMTVRTRLNPTCDVSLTVDNVPPYQCVLPPRSRRPVADRLPRVDVKQRLGAEPSPPHGSDFAAVWIGSQSYGLGSSHRPRCFEQQKSLIAQRCCGCRVRKSFIAGLPQSCHFFCGCLIK